jgi:CheY-like chemotaxis protein
VSNIEQILRAKFLTLSLETSHMRSLALLKPQSEMFLCIDDNPDVLECEKAFLESFGYTVVTAPGPQRGLKLAARHSVDVVIVDFLCPRWTGAELI